jgi:predicted nucleotidyltransferase
MTDSTAHKPLTLSELRARRAAILDVARQHGALNVRVFGSAVRGDTHPASDVDFLVDMERGRSLLDLGALLMDLADLLDQDVDVVTEKGLRDRLRPRVLAEAQPL